MNKVVKHLILYMSRLEGLIQDEKLFLGLGLNKELKQISNAILKTSQKLGKHTTKEDFDKLTNDIKSGAIAVEIIHDFEKRMNAKRMSKLRVNVNYEALKDLHELAMWKVCDDCDYKKKKCNLKKTSKMLNEYNIYAPCQAEQFETKRINII